MQRAVKVLAKERSPLQDDKEREVLFGATQYARRQAALLHRERPRRAALCLGRPLRKTPAPPAPPTLA